MLQKCFFTKNDYNIAQNATSIVHTIMNSKGHNKGHNVHRYTRKYTPRNLRNNPKTAKLYNNIKKTYKQSTTRNIINNAPLHILRMPNLGYDAKYVSKSYVLDPIRKCPFGTILEQIVKVIGQTTSLATNGYGHFDIRDSNVMITPTTGAITIIDFDWVMKFDDYFSYGYSFGFYNNPPECILYTKWVKAFQYRDNIEPLLNSKEIKPIFDTYIEYQLSGFRNVFSNWNIHNAESYKRLLVPYILPDNIMSLYPFSEDMSEEKIFQIYVMTTIDNFSLGLTLLQIIANIYNIDSYVSYFNHVKSDKPGDAPMDTRGYIKSKLTDLITDGDRKYTSYELNKIADALDKIILLLHKMCSLLIRYRPTPDAAYAQALDILTKYNT